MHEREFLNSIRIPLPPLPEQRAIAHVLRTVQRAKEATERVIAGTRELKKSLMRHLFTYGPVPVGETDRVPLKESEIGLVPEGWEVRLFSELVEIASGQVDPSSQPYSEWLHIGPENIEEGTGKIIAPRTNKAMGIRSGNYAFSRGDILYSKIRPYLRKAALPSFRGTCSADVYPLRPRTDSLDREYLFHWLLTDQFTEQVVPHQGRTRIPKVNRSQLGSVLLPVPPLVEQREIADALRAVGRRTEAEEKRKQALDALFRTLLDSLMTGKVRVGDLELPKDVVASATR